MLRLPAPRKLSERICFLVWFVLFILVVLFVALVSGCSGTHTARSPTLASSTTLSAATDYVSDLDQVASWQKPVVTYRFVEVGATDVRVQPIPAKPISEQQKAECRAAFAKWQAAINSSVQFVETSQPGADIDIVVQDDDAFQETVTWEQYGATNIWIRDVDKRAIGRAVIRMRSDLSQQLFRYVALHEAGHALFAVGHSKGSGDIMSVSVTSLAPDVELSERDENTIKVAYGVLTNAL